MLYSRIFIPKKGLLGRVFGTAWPKILKRCSFWTPTKKPEHEIFKIGGCCLQLQRNLTKPHRPRHTPTQKPCFLGSACGFPGIKVNWLRWVARLTWFEGRGHEKVPKGPPFAYVFWKDFKGSPLCLCFLEKFRKQIIKGGGGGVLAFSHLPLDFTGGPWPPAPPPLNAPLAKMRKTSDASSFLSHPQHFEMFGQATWNCGTQTSLFKGEHLGRKYVTVFAFLQRPKVISTIAVLIGNAKKGGPLCLGAGACEVGKSPGAKPLCPSVS